MSFFEKYKKIFIVGIGGSGVSALARFLSLNNCKIEGSDSGYSGNLDNEKNIKIHKEHKESNVDGSFDLLIYSSAVLDTNPERQKAKELGIKEFNYFEALGAISSEFNTVAISGTNGKSTTTALTGILLSDTKFDPSVIMGAGVCGFGFDNNFKKGTTNNLVIEACEYQAHMLNVDPKTIILTNIEAEHLDYYRDINHIIDTFKEYVNKLVKNNGNLIYNADNENTRIVAEYFISKKTSSKVLSFGIDNEANIMAKNIEIKDEKQYFDLYLNGIKIERLSLNVPGKFNISNFLGAIACFVLLNNLEINSEVLNKIKNVSNLFNGIERRFEIVKKNNEKNIIYISDYAHNPYKIKATLSGVRDFYKNRRIVVIFEPHTYDRTKKLFNEFVDSFIDFDVLILSEIYEPTGRDTNSDKSISSNDLLIEIKKIKGQNNKEYYFGKDIYETKEIMNSITKNNDLVLVMGAGKINKILD